ncbi:Transcription factor BIM1 [Linum perenne]
MELTQQRNSFSAEGRKPTLEFLSLCSHSTAQQQDPRPSSQGVYLKTHDFLQPLERGGGRAAAAAKEETEVSTVEKTPTPTPVLPPQAPPPTSVEHILPGGIGTYSISHISYYNNQRVPKPEGSVFTAAAQTSSADKNEENSNCSSYTGSGFTLWEESALKKGKTGKENMTSERSSVAREATVKTTGQWTTSERPSQSSANYHSNHFSSLSPPDQPSGQKRRSFMDMMKSAKGDEDLEDDEDLILKKESPPPTSKAELIVKVDGKNSDQKANTPRSKHSATEQRRRSKINDRHVLTLISFGPFGLVSFNSNASRESNKNWHCRFQMLREIIPHGDQKRDKASFLLEVIEYIQFLHEKVHKYEGPYQGWNLDPEKLAPWKSNNRTDESYVDQSRGVNGDANSGLVYAPKLDEKNVSISPAIPGRVQNPADSDTSSATTPSHHSGVANKAAMPFPMSLQPNLFNSARAGCSSAQAASPQVISTDINSATTQPGHSRSGAANGFDGVDNKLKEHGLNVEGGTISISSAYSRGLLSSLTEALRSSGVDLSQANISVQIEVGKGTKTTKNAAPPSIAKENSEIQFSSNQGKTSQFFKKLKTG